MANRLSTIELGSAVLPSDMDYMTAERQERQRRERQWHAAKGSLHIKHWLLWLGLSHDM